ncbi:MAG: class I SAM-dependent methyltransferase [Terriglobales bacterium]
MKPVSLYKFGGTEELLRRVQKPFVAYFQNSAPVLDIGCGRGVFLQLLAEAGIPAVGIDHSEEAIVSCQEKGLTVHHEDGCEFLGQSGGKFGGIFCSHVIEHMGYEDAMNFLELCYGALRANGTILLITPNPKDLAVISEVFWLDPTHVRPYPGLLLKAMLEAVGFKVSSERQFLGDWRMVGRRNLPRYFLWKMLLGQYYGKSNTMVLAAKVEDSA